MYGAVAQDTILPDMSARISKESIKEVQQVIQGCLYYGRTIYDTIVLQLSSITNDQTSAIERTSVKVLKMLNYLATHNNVCIRYCTKYTFRYIILDRTKN